MSHRLSIANLLQIAVLLAVTGANSPAWSQHGHGGGGHGGGHGYGGHGGGHGYGGHGYGGHGYGGHGYGGHGYGGHGYGGHGYGYAHGYGHHSYGHGGYLHGDYHGYYPYYTHYHGYYPYYGWYPSFNVSLYPWYGFYDADDAVESVVVNRPVTVDGQADQERRSTSREEDRTEPRSGVTARGLQYQRQAESAFRNGRYDQALRLANHALVEMPRNGKLLLLVSHCLLATANYQGAAATIHQASTMLEKRDWGYVAKNWRTYYRGKAYDQAMDKLNEYVTKDPDAAYARFLRGYHYGFLDHEEYARKELRQAIKLESRDRLAVELLTMFGGAPETGDNVKSDSPSAPDSDAPHDEPSHNHHDHEHDSHPADVPVADGNPTP